MSKKTRKKSPKAAVRGAAPAAARKSTKKPPAKAPSRPAKKPAQKAASRPTRAPAKTLTKTSPSASTTESHKAASKPLRSEAPAKLASEGANAPGFRLPRDGGDTVSLSDFSGRKLVLFFYPRADTPGCTKEAIEFTRLAGAFAEAQTAILGISADTLRALESFRDKHQLSIPLVSDEKHEVLQAYGAWGEKSMYGRTFHGILRTTVLIDGAGSVARIWRNVRVDGHADEVLAAARAL
jgi:thioredoxin-dependent peroxiredoxin